MEKKKNSIWTLILNVLVIVIFLAGIAVGGVFGFVYFKYKVNVFDCIGQISDLNQTVNVNKLVTNAPSDDDYNSIQNKINVAESTDSIVQLEFTDRELCAYLNHNLDKISSFNLAGTTFNVTDNNLTILQIKFSNIDLDQPSEHYCDMNVVLKYNIAKLKAEKMTDFPLNLLKNFIPDELYFSVNCSIDEVEGEYQVTPKSIKVNNLSARNTKSLFGNVNHFVTFITAEELNQNISSTLTNALLGNDGFYGVLHDNDATGYGWQKENKFRVYFVDLGITRSIDYHDSRNLGVANPNPTEYTIRNNVITLKDLTCNGYNFLGWYTNIDDESTKVTTIEAGDLVNYDLTCKWELITYVITCDLRGGEINGNSEYNITYNVETPTFNLNDTATKRINDDLTLEFDGWAGEGLTEHTKIVTIAQGSYGNRHYAAYYEGEQVEVSLYLDNQIVDTCMVDTGSILTLNNLNSLFSDNFQPGYSISKCYTNAGLTDEYDYSAPVLAGKTLYAQLSYLTDCVYFYPYLAEFNYATSHNTVLNITSHEMLIGYIDYCIFYNITQDNDARLSLTYYHGHTSQQIINEISDAANERNERRAFAVGYDARCASDGHYGYYYLSSSDATVMATEHYDGNVHTPNVYPQQDYVFRADDLNIREDDNYNNFKINSVKNTLTVTNSEQLVWAMENGYKPNCVANSAAERVYNAAKATLRNICTDDMTDFEKIHAIYQWLALNVNYDQEALAVFESMHNAEVASATAVKYDSWYPEGVFFYNKAVCEGYAKALLIMAKIEGIPAICVSGNGHMWNKVYLGGKWYGIDATHADISYTESHHTVELFTNVQFLFTDAYKTADDHPTTDYAEFIANTVYDYYDNTEFTYNGHTYDLFIDDQAELIALINYIGTYTSDIDCSYYTVEIATNNFSRASIDLCLNTYGWSVVQFNEQLKDANNHSVFILKHNAA